MVQLKTYIAINFKSNFKSNVQSDVSILILVPNLTMFPTYISKLTIIIKFGMISSEMQIF